MVISRNNFDVTHIVALESVVGVPWDGRRKTIDARRITQLRVLCTLQQACGELSIPLCLCYVSCARIEMYSKAKLTVLAAMLWA